MHIIIGLLGAIVSLLYILDRLGIDIGWLNPFSWARRRAWAQKYEGDPIYAVEDPVQVAAILVVGVARLGGDVGAEQKQAIVGAFAATFSLSDSDANGLYISAQHLLGAPQIIENQLNGVVDKHRDAFSPEQAASLLDMIRATVDSPSEAQRTFVDSIASRLEVRPAAGVWG